MRHAVSSRAAILQRGGNAVANTYTLNDWFDNGVVVEGAGTRCGVDRR